MIAALQAVTATATYPALTLAISLAANVLDNMLSPDAAARTAFLLFGLPTVLGALLLAAMFMAVPLGVGVAGAMVLRPLGRGSGAVPSVFQLVKFGATVVIANVAVLLIGVLFWPLWFYSEKLATLIPLWPLVLAVALNAILDATMVGITLRSRLTKR